MNGFLKIDLGKGELADVTGTAIVRNCAFFLVERRGGFTWYMNEQGYCRLYMDVNISELPYEELDDDGDVNEYRMLHEKLEADQRFMVIYDV